MSLVDGEAAHDEFARDRGLAFGDGVFETLAWYDVRLLGWSRHMERLRRGCDTLGIPLPSDRVLYDECLAVARNLPRAVVKIIITRGSGGWGYRTPSKPAPRRIGRPSVACSHRLRGNQNLDMQAARQHQSIDGRHQTPQPARPGSCEP